MQLCEAEAGPDRLFNAEVVRQEDKVVYLASGWKVFAKAYSRDMGNFLFVSYDGVDTLTFKVFDRSMCCKYYQPTVPTTVMDQLCVLPKGMSLDGWQEAIVKNCHAQNQPKILMATSW